MKIITLLALVVLCGCAMTEEEREKADYITAERLIQQAEYYMQQKEACEAIGGVMRMRGQDTRTRRSLSWNDYANARCVRL